ncbi:MAG: hypothetical protein N4A35_01700 [Flavobacteriales bacterium]|jgi:hypothetical protein|nr:hypothetical protein [Flavobacteriales bacterium]
MDRLLIKYRFQVLPFIVADGKGEFYQLPHCVNKYFKPLRKLDLVLNNGITKRYRINRKFISLHQLRKKAYILNDVIEFDNSIRNLPF